MRSDCWTETHHHHLLLFFLLIVSRFWSAGALGVHWGTASSHPLPPDTVVGALLRANGIGRVKLSGADPAVLSSLAGSGIRVTVGIPNEMLRPLSSSKTNARSWVHDNVTRYLTGGSVVRIEYIAVGDEPFLLDYGQQFQPFVIGAVTNIQLALTAAKLENKVKVIVPCDSDAYQSDSRLPSGGHFRPDLNETMAQLLSFLTKHGSPFVVDIDPFSSLRQSKNLSMGYFLFQTGSSPVVDGRHRYRNSFDASVDTLVASLTKAGYDNIEIVVGRIGWPTDGAPNATSAIAQKFMRGLVNHLQSKTGTPLRPKNPPSETYIFGLLDEDRSRDLERHRGIFTFDGQAKYNVDLGQGLKKTLVDAENVEYLASKWCVVNNNDNNDLSNVSSSFSDACSKADCTALSLGGSCFGVGWPENVSYAFNSYYQQQDQRAEGCDFNGLGMITTVDPSVGDCRFAITIDTSSSTYVNRISLLWLPVILSACVLEPFRHLLWF